MRRLIESGRVCRVGSTTVSVFGSACRRCNDPFDWQEQDVRWEEQKQELKVGEAVRGGFMKLVTGIRGTEDTQMPLVANTKQSTNTEYSEAGFMYPRRTHIVSKVYQAMHDQIFSRLPTFRRACLYEVIGSSSTSSFSQDSP